jgi:hypothetical protein
MCLGRYTNQLVILSGIRNLDETTLKILEDMPITNISLEDFYTYLKGMENKQKGIIRKILQSKLLTIDQIPDLVGVEQDYVL